MVELPFSALGISWPSPWSDARLLAVRAFVALSFCLVGVRDLGFRVLGFRDLGFRV